MTAGAYRRKVAAAAGIALAVFGSIVFFAARRLPAPAGCSVHLRNPYRFRDWANYADGVRHLEDGAWVALITNSQGYAGEYPAHRGYPARLEARLNERRTGGHAHWKVANLSIDGVTPMEYMALAVRLRETAPTWVISIAGSVDFRAANDGRGFAYARSDAPNLLTEFAAARRLPRAFWRRHGRVEDTLEAWMAHRLPLLPFRDYAWSRLDARYPGAQRYFYAPRTTYHFWQGPVAPRTAPLPAPPGTGGGETLDLRYGGVSTVMLDEFLEQLARIPAGHRLVAASPLRAAAGLRREDPWIDAFRSDLARLSEARGLPFRDLTDALPARDFITGNHLHDRNHRRLAELLADHIAAEMGP